MKKNVLIYGNCQHTHLERMLSLTPEFTKFYNFVKVKDVYCRDKTNLDDETLSKVDLFLYQHVSENFDPYFCTDSIIARLKTGCEKICIPNFWFSGYFPQQTKNPIYRENKKYSIAPSGIFPYGDRFIIESLKRFDNKKEIFDYLCSDFLTKEEIERNIKESIRELKRREMEFQVDIPSSQYIEECFSRSQLCYTVNHPTREYFLWLIEHILKKIQISTSSVEKINYSPFTENHIHIPIYPVVARHLDLKFVNSNANAKQYLFYRNKYSFSDYVEYYIEHSTYGNVNGYDIIDSGRYQQIKKNKITAIESAISRKNLENHTRVFSCNSVFTGNADNQVYFNGRLFICAQGQEIDSIPGLKIKFKGRGNKVFLDRSCRFRDSLIDLGSNAFVNIQSSIWNCLNINNKSHDGGVLFIGNKCIGGSGLSIDIFGNNRCFIDDGCIFGKNVTITCSDGHSIFDMNDLKLLNPNNDVYVGRKVWFGNFVSVLKGAILNDNSVVALGSVVTKGDYLSNSILAGVPARIIQKNIDWEVKNPDKFLA